MNIEVTTYRRSVKDPSRLLPGQSLYTVVVNAPISGVKSLTARDGRPEELFKKLMHSLTSPERDGALYIATIDAITLASMSYYNQCRVATLTGYTDPAAALATIKQTLQLVFDNCGNVVRLGNPFRAS
jgi:hypothetical protein